VHALPQASGRRPPPGSVVRARYVVVEAGKRQRVDEGRGMTDDELEQEFLRLAETGEVDRILRGLRNRYDRVPRDVVLEIYSDATVAVVQRHKRRQNITNLAGLLTTIAKRRLQEVWEAMQQAEATQSLFELRVQHPDVWEHDEERAAKVERAAGFIRDLVPRLDNENYRRTLVTLLDAAQAGMQLENKELADVLGCAPNTAGMWKLRAYQRLRRLLEEAGIVSWEHLLDLLPLPDDADDYATGDENDDEEEETDE
jgi:DNA-directed RNA polymerase specialized sigma24 family protein